MLNKIPIIGWILSAIGAIGLSVPFWFFWTVMEIGKRYFYFVPATYQSIGFADCVGLFIVIAILKGTLTPNIFSVSNSQAVRNDGREDKTIEIIKR